MRLCTILSGGKPAVGVKMGNGKIVDLSKQMPRGPKSVVEILAGGKKLQAEVAKACAKPKAGATVSEKSAKYLPPIPNPGKILCIGLNYRKHAEETGSPIPGYPVVFCRFDNTLVPHNGKMPRPSHSDQLDWEAELTIVIGKKCRNVPKENALGVIAGYACFNDGSVRDWQRHTVQWTAGKNFAQTGGFGPWMVGTDEIAPGTLMTLSCRLNGERMQHATTEMMIFKIPRLIEYISAFMPLAAGDVIVTGTPGGVGARRTPPVWMKPGDTVEIEIDKVGVLVNTIGED